MRLVEIPVSIKLGTSEDGKDVFLSFGKWMDESVLNDPKVGKKASGILTAVKLAKKFNEAPEMTKVHLEEVDWELLKDVVEEPTGAYNPIVARKLVTFIKAVLEAEQD